jgi:DNA processing protein
MRSAATALGKLTRYDPPAHWTEIAVKDLLAGTARWDPEAPPQLNFLTDSPRMSEAAGRVFAVGDLSLVKRQCVSIIGTRRVSEQGALRARKIARGLVQHGVVVVSGLAEGVDTAAMTSAIEHGGRTIGVIGTPLDKAYPAQNAALQETVYREHLLVSQFAVGEKTWPGNFPRRNRLMATISDATVIVEASDSSGTLHQAAECKRLGRWLFIMKSVAEDRTLTWPKSFLGQPKTAVLEQVEDVLRAISNEQAT